MGCGKVTVLGRQPVVRGRQNALTAEHTLMARGDAWRPAAGYDGFPGNSCEGTQHHPDTGHDASRDGSVGDCRQRGHVWQRNLDDIEAQDCRFVAGTRLHRPAHPPQQAIAFMANSCARILARRVAIQKRPMSPRVIREALNGQQWAVQNDPENGKRHVIPSRPSAVAKAVDANVRLDVSDRRSG